MTVLPFLLRLMQSRVFRGRLRGEEDATVIAFANACRQWTLEGRLRATWTNIPHEVGAVSRTLGKGMEQRINPAFRTAQARYAKALAQGLVPGSGDFVFAPGGWLEFKSSSGSLSDDQRDFRDWCQAISIPYVVCRSVESGEAALKKWGVLAP